MTQSRHRFGLAASSPNLSESSLAGWAAVFGFAALTLGPIGRSGSLHEPSQLTRQTGFRQIVGAPPQTPGGFEECSWGLQTPAGAPPDPAGAAAQTPFMRGCGGGSPQRSMGRSPCKCLGQPPATFFWRSRHKVWGGAPTVVAPLPPPPSTPPLADLKFEMSKITDQCSILNR